MAYSIRETTVKIRSFEHGLNNNDRPSDVGERYTGRYPKFQCIDTLNMILDSMTRKKGAEGLKYDITGTIEGVAFYQQYSGSEAVLVVSGGKLYSFNTSTYALTELYDLTGSGNAKFVTAYDKCFVCNGSEVVKVENSTAYKVGITPPSGATAAAKAGGTLPLGVYKVIVGYARKVLGVNVLYSVGEALADVTLSGGNQTITFSIPNSSDSQVNNKIVWLTDAGATVPYYFYHETDDNTTVTFDVTSNTNKDNSKIYSSRAQNNVRPEDFEDITFLDSRIFGKIDNTIYFSKQAGTVYNLECFPDANTFDLPYYIVSLFTNDGNLYANCINQIVKIPNGDPYARTIEVYGKSFNGSRSYFKYPKTIINNSDYVLGLTQDGVKMFSGDKMITVDISKDVKPEITEAYNGATDPAGMLIRQNNRTEYHLSYCDSTYGTGTNNRTIVLNLDSLSIDPGKNIAVVSAWEKYDTGFDFCSVDSAGSTAYYCQSVSGKSVIYKNKSSEVTDENIYIGDTFTALRTPECYVLSPYFVKDIRGSVKWLKIHMAARQSASYYVKVWVSRDKAYSAVADFEKSGTGFILGTSHLGTGRLSGTYPTFSDEGLPRTMKGPMVWVEIGQTENDRTFQFLQAVLTGQLTIGRRT